MAGAEIAGHLENRLSADNMGVITTVDEIKTFFTLKIATAARRDGHRTEIGAKRNAEIDHEILEHEELDGDIFRLRLGKMKGSGLKDEIGAGRVDVVALELFLREGDNFSFDVFGRLAHRLGIGVDIDALRRVLG